MIDKKVDIKSFVKDGYQNFMAKIGIGANELQSGSSYSSNLATVTLDRTKLENIYETSWVAGRGIDVVADDMTKKGIDIKSSLTPEQVLTVQAKLEELGVWEVLNDSIKWGLLYGGAIAVIIIDGDDLCTPLDIDSVNEGDFKGLKVYDRWMCTPSLEVIAELCQEQSLPMYYEVYPTQLGQEPSLGKGYIYKIHHSRCIRFLGIKMPYWRAVQNLQWGVSIVSRWYDRLTAYDSATLGASSLLYKSYLRTIKIKGLRSILATGGQAEENLIKMFTYLSDMEGSEGITMLDAEDEFTTHNWSFSGMSEALLSFAEQIAGALETPLVRLLGQTPHGLSSNTDSDLANYYDGIASKQNRILKAPMNKIVGLTLKTLGLKDDKISFTFRPLWELKEEQKINLASGLVAAVTQAEGSGLISKSDASLELKEQSRTTGVFTNIDEAWIKDLKDTDEVPDADEVIDETRQDKLQASGDDTNGLRKAPKENSTAVQKTDKK